MAKNPLYYLNDAGIMVPVSEGNPLPITIEGLITQDDLDAYMPLLMRAAVNGVASLDAGGKIPDGQIPAAITRDTELTAATDLLVPLTQRNANNGYLGLDGAGLIPDARIPAGITRDTELTDAINALVGAAPGALNTLAELATALGNDAALATTLTNLIATKAPLESQLKATAVKTANYAAIPGDFVPVDTSAGVVTVTLPNNPADGTVLAVKRTVGAVNNASVACAGTDVFNVAGGAVTATLSVLNQQYNFVYKATGRIWYVETNFSRTGLDSLYSGKLLGSAINTSDTTLGATVTAISLIGGGLSIPITVGSKPIKVAWGGVVYHSGGSQGPLLGLWEDGVKIEQVYFSTGIANQQCSLWKERTLTPAAGAHTYEVKLGQTVAAATAHAFGSAAGPLTLIATEA